MINLSLDDLKLVAKNRGIEDYKNKSEDGLIKILSEPKTKIRLFKNRIVVKKDVNKPRQIRKSLHSMKNLRIKQTRKSFYGIKKPKNLFKSKSLSKSKIKQIRNDINPPPK